MLIDGKRAVIELNSFDVPPIFNLIKKTGNIADEMMYNTFNCGLGMVLAVDKADVDKTVKAINESGEKAFVVGKIINGEKGVDLV